MKDFFLGKLVKYSFSLILLATILTLSKELYLFNSTCSYPLSLYETSLPPTLVPVVVLILAVISVFPPSSPTGLKLSTYGTIASYNIFSVAIMSSPPTNLSSENDNCGSKLTSEFLLVPVSYTHLTLPRI